MINNVVFYVFSGTGNTLTAAGAIASFLEEKQIQTVIYKIGNDNPAPVPDPNDFDAACFAYPIHAFNAPLFFQRFIRTLPRLKEEKRGMPAFIFKTSGEPFRPNNASSFSLSRILKKKGFVPYSDMHMLMPYNIIFRYPDAMAKQMYLHTTEVMAPKIAEQIIQNKKSPIRYNPATILWSYILRLEWFGAWLNSRLMHADKNKCLKCGKCAASCPSGNIRMEEKPRYENRCILCMRCVMCCPQDAVKPGLFNLWKVYPAWNYKRLSEDPSVADNWTDKENAGYFRLFRSYYKKNS